ncbi:MAG: protein phosphatase 2C domain-containing protein [Micropruina sp.]|uniref:PP2C family protein-serine/threonine phosphatase n=1 Tax=Micropruina sp. TaxID=2737536 RepID=UPI0039E5C2BB
MTLTLSYVARSEIGLVRKNNQDSAYVSPTMLMVADGMGGAAAGDLASAVAIGELRESDGDLGGTDMLEVVAGAIAHANERIRDLVAHDPSLDGMGTTVCGLLFDGERLAVANIGDSRAYRLRDGHFERITRDHSWVQSLVDDGRITEAEALLHPHRSLILKVLNGQPNHQPDLEMSDVKAGDRYLICSDGLCGMVTDAAIEKLVGGTDPDQVVEQLIKIAYDEGGLDNITIILADVVEDGVPGPTMVLGAAAEIDTEMAPDEAEDTRPLPTEGAEPADPQAEERAEQARYQPTTRGRASAWVKVVLGIVLPLLVLGGGVFGWYSFTQTKYFVGDSDDQVAVFRGVPDRVFGINLSTVLQVHNTHVSDLPLFYQEKVRAAIVVPDLDAANTATEELRVIAQHCIAQREDRARTTTAPKPPNPAVSPSVSATTSPSPGASPSANSSPSAEPTPKAPEDC